MDEKEYKKFKIREKRNKYERERKKRSEENRKLRLKSFYNHGKVTYDFLYNEKNIFQKAFYKLKKMFYGK